MSKDILNEYVKITTIIQNIQEKIDRYKKSIEESLQNSTSDKEKEYIFKEFEEKISRIQNDPNITSRYRELKNRQDELRKRLIPDKRNDIDTVLSDLKVKYVDLANKNIVMVDDNEYKCIDLNKEKTVRDIQLNTILNEVQKKLNEGENR